MMISKERVKNTILSRLSNPANLKGLWFYDITAGQYIEDFSDNNHTMLLSTDASNLSPDNGSLYFSNTGRLYFNSTGSIEYEWPWKIYGISGFRQNHLLDAGTESLGNALLPTVFYNSVDLGDNNTTAFSILPEISFKTGSVYGPYTEMTDSNPVYVSASFDPSIGFNMKVRLTSREAIKFDTQGAAATASYSIGEYITGSISNAKARIISI
jgi:hypothetical protein